MNLRLIEFCLALYSWSLFDILHNVVAPYILISAFLSVELAKCVYPHCALRVHGLKLRKKSDNTGEAANEHRRSNEPTVVHDHEDDIGGSLGELINVGEDEGERERHNSSSTTTIVEDDIVMGEESGPSLSLAAELTNPDETKPPPTKSSSTIKSCYSSSGKSSSFSGGNIEIEMKVERMIQKIHHESERRRLDLGCKYCDINGYFQSAIVNYGNPDSYFGTEIALSMLEHGLIDVHNEDSTGKTALCYAVLKNNLEVVEALLGYQDANLKRCALLRRKLGGRKCEEHVLQNFYVVWHVASFLRRKVGFVDLYYDLMISKACVLVPRLGIRCAGRVSHFLCANLVDVNHVNRDGKLVLNECIRKGGKFLDKVGVIEAILRHKNFDINKKDKVCQATALTTLLDIPTNYRTAVMYVDELRSVRKNMQILELLLRHRNIDTNFVPSAKYSDINTEVWSIHCRVNHTTPLVFLITQARNGHLFWSANGNEHDAGSKTELEKFKLVLNHPTTDVNLASDNEGHLTPLCAAFLWGTLEHVQLLLDHHKIEVEFFTNNHPPTGSYGGGNGSTKYNNYQNLTMLGRAILDRVNRGFTHGCIKFGKKIQAFMDRGYDLEIRALLGDQIVETLKRESYDYLIGGIRIS